MVKRNYQFWLVYSAAWLAYSASLGTVFIGVGNHFDFNLLLRIFCNVAPAASLGLLVFQICQKWKWSERRQPQFILIHILSLVLFAVLWCFFTLLNLSIVSFLQSGVWTFVLWDIYALQWQLFSGVMAYGTITSAVYVKQINENLQIEEHRNSELRLRAIRAEAARASAELASLRSQLNPHFLFNTLHSLMALVRTDSSTAEEAIERFASMLRYVLQSQQHDDRNASADVTFEEEWKFVCNYLELERLRLGERLMLTTRIEPAALACYLPAFTLQPIVENAVKHSIAPRASGGRICIEAQTEGDNLVIEVSDDGTGNFSLSKYNGSEQKTSGLGLRLVRESLAARYGAAANLIVKSQTDLGYSVAITIPRINSSEVVSSRSGVE